MVKRAPDGQKWPLQRRSLEGSRCERLPCWNHQLHILSTSPSSPLLPSPGERQENKWSRMSEGLHKYMDRGKST
jgi:hypothetical protein